MLSVTQTGRADGIALATACYFFRTLAERVKFEHCVLAGSRIPECKG